MDEYFSHFYNDAGFGPALATRPVPARSLEKYKGKVPNKLLEYWQLYGWGGYGQGLFWTVDPDAWEPVLDAWIGDTPFMSSDAYHVIARSAFGELFLWGEKTGFSLSISPAYSRIFPRTRSVITSDQERDFETQLFFESTERGHLDFSDVDERGLFGQAVEKLGILDHDTMYGFIPALALGGTPKLGSLQRVSAIEHLVLLAQMTSPVVMLDIAKLAQ